MYGERLLHIASASLAPFIKKFNFSTENGGNINVSSRSRGICGRIETAAPSPMIKTASGVRICTDILNGGEHAGTIPNNSSEEGKDSKRLQKTA